MTADLIRRCLTAAIAAPSIHNTQPWLFRMREDGVDVLLDRSRQLPTIDPDGRELHLSVGAAVFNLRVALAAYGRRADVALAPPGSDDSLAATVQIGPPVPPTAPALALLRAITRRHTNRRPFADTRIPVSVTAELQTAASREGGTLQITNGPLHAAVLGLTRTADRRLRDEPGYERELAAWTTPPGVSRRDGVPRSAFGPRAVRGTVPLRDLSLGHHAPASVVEFEAHPKLALLHVNGDEPRDWLRAGAALQRIWLTATIRGLALTPLTQVVEIPELRDLLADGDLGPVQSLMRLGYPLCPTLPVPRRSLEDVTLAVHG